MGEVIDIKGRIPLIIEPIDKNKELRVISAWVEGDSVFLEVKRGDYTFHKKDKFSLQISPKSLYCSIKKLDN